MCLVVVALDAHPHYALVVAANRDEFHARDALAAQWGEAPPFAGILSGRDLTAGGTWLGVRRDGRWALVTNVREGGHNDPTAPSRGGLVPAILNDGSPPQAALAGLMRDAGRYNGFNVLAGTIADATWASNRAPEARTLLPGLHGLSNALLDTPWPKVARTRDAVGDWAARGDTDLSPLFSALADRTQAPDVALPETGISIERERLLSAPFIVSDDYGTRCATVVAITRRGDARFVERTFDAQGHVRDEAAFEFEIARRTV